MANQRQIRTTDSPIVTFEWTFPHAALTRAQESYNGTIPTKGHNIKAVGTEWFPSMKIAGAEEVYMIGVSLPVTALARAMVISGLMWVAIGIQAAIWIN